MISYKRDPIFLDAFGPVNISVTNITSSSAVMKRQRPWTDYCRILETYTVFNMCYLSNGKINHRNCDSNDGSWFIFSQELDFNWRTVIAQMDIFLLINFSHL